MLKRRPRQCPSSAPPPPHGPAGGSGLLGPPCGERPRLGGNHSLGASTPPSRKPSTLLCASLQELSELKAIEAAIGEFLDLGKSLKFDVTSREDINGYSGATPVLYNKFLFRAG